MEYYENLKVIREDRGYTQKQIAEVLQTTRQYYNEYENGKREIPIRVYVKLSRFYKVSIDYLAGEVNEPSPKKEQKKQKKDRAISITQKNNVNAIVNIAESRGKK